MPPMTDVVKNLLIINVLFFLATMLFGEQEMYNLLALHYPTSELFKPLQLVTHFFMHGGFMHIAFNMFALVMFGSALESMWGPKRFLFFYFACAFGSAALHMSYTWWEMNELTNTIQAFSHQPSIELFRSFTENTPLNTLTNAAGTVTGDSMAADILRDMRKGLNPENIDGAKNMMDSWYNINVNIPMLGASGAIYGLLLGFGMKFPNVELMLIFLPIPIKAKFFIPALMLIELFLGFNQFSWDNMAHFAHLGGALMGFLLILYWNKFGTQL